MEIKEARFVISNTDIEKCPAPDKPEYAFIGRSNVGKSSLLNMLTNKRSLAKISVKPGKTRLINHYIINEEWYLVDLPGYGYAGVPLAERVKWEKFIRKYILERPNLYCLFVLVDLRHEPQKIDVEFMNWLGFNGIAFAIIFTKSDKLKPEEVEPKTDQYKAVLHQTWEELPHYFVTSSEKFTGRTEILSFIERVNRDNQNN